jgi:hypothetical protein
VNFTFYGKFVETRTHKSTIKDLLDERGISLGENDWLSLGLETEIYSGIELELARQGKSTIEVEETLAFKENITYDYDREKGYREVKTEGENGQKTVVYEIELKNGEEVSRSKISEIITKEAVAASVVVGVKSNETSASENERITWHYLRKQGFSAKQTAGIMGNLQQEHGFKTSNAAGGLGIAQWTGGRKTNLLKWSDPYSIYTQLDFLMSELNGGYAKVKSALLSANSIEESTRIFQNQFERCGVCRESSRISFAYEFYARYKDE